MKKSFLIFLLITSFTALAETSDPSEVTEISLERTRCFGTCPVYKLTVLSDGTVTYDGKEYVKEIGRRSGTISKKQFQELASKAKEIKFFSLKNEYLTKEASDGSIVTVTDLPTRIITVKTRKDSKTIRNYYGGPDHLKTLELMIDKTCNSEIWVKGSNQSLQ